MVLHQLVSMTLYTMTYGSTYTSQYVIVYNDHDHDPLGSMTSTLYTMIYGSTPTSQYEIVYYYLWFYTH